MSYETVDVSVFPKFKEQTLSLISELELVYNRNDFSEGMKANQFRVILKKYDCLP